MRKSSPSVALAASTFLVASLAAVFVILGTSSSPRGEEGDGRASLSLESGPSSTSRPEFVPRVLDATPSGALTRTQRTEAVEREAGGCTILVVDAEGEPCAGIPVAVMEVREPASIATLVHALQEGDLQWGGIAHTELTPPTRSIAIEWTGSEEGERQRRLEVLRLREAVMEAEASVTARARLDRLHTRTIRLSSEALVLTTQVGVSLPILRAPVPRQPFSVHRASRFEWTGVTGEDGQVHLPAEWDERAGLQATFAFPTQVDRAVSFPEPVEDAPVQERRVTLELPEVLRHDVTFVDDLPGSASRKWKGRLVAVRARNGEEVLETLEDESELRDEMSWIVEAGVRVQLHVYVTQGFAPWVTVPLGGEPKGSGTFRQTIRSSEHYAHATVRVVDPLGRRISHANGRLSFARHSEWNSEGTGKETQEQGTLSFAEDGSLSFLLDAGLPDLHHRHLELQALVADLEGFGGKRPHVESSPGSSDAVGIGDRVLAIDGQPIDSFESLIEFHLGETAGPEEKPEPVRTWVRTVKPDSMNAPDLSAWVDLTTPYAPGTVIDLGEVTVGQGPWIVEGCVLEEAGIPIAGAKVLVRNTARKARTIETVVTDERGAFCVRGLTPYDSLSLLVRAEEYLAPEVPVVPAGARGVRIVLRRAGSVRVHATSPHEMLAKRGTLRCLLRAEATGATQAEGIGDSPSTVIERLLPGEYQAYLALHGTPLSGTERVLVRSGMETPCSVFANLDLSRAIVPITLRLVDESGANVQGRRLRIQGWFEGQRRTTPTYSTNRDGLETFFVPASWTKLEAVVQRGESHDLRLTEDVQVLRLVR